MPRAAVGGDLFELEIAERFAAAECVPVGGQPACVEAGVRQIPHRRADEVRFAAERTGGQPEGVGAQTEAGLGVLFPEPVGRDLRQPAKGALAIAQLLDCDHAGLLRLGFTQGERELARDLAQGVDLVGTPHSGLGRVERQQADQSPGMRQRHVQTGSGQAQVGQLQRLDTRIGAPVLDQAGAAGSQHGEVFGRLGIVDLVSGRVRQSGRGHRLDCHQPSAFVQCRVGDAQRGIAARQRCDRAFDDIGHG